VAAFLTIALLPLGLIALYQTREFQEETERRAELSLLALTEQGAAGVEQALKETLGTGEAVGLMASLLDSPETCSEVLGRFTAQSDRFGFVGLLPPEGPVTCSSAPAAFDPDDRDEWEGVFDNPQTIIRAEDRGTVSGEPVLIVAMPLEVTPDGRAGRYLALSIPRGRIASSRAVDPSLQPLRLITFNAQGEVLTFMGQGAEGRSLGDLLPQGYDLTRERTEQPRVFQGPSAGGGELVYTVVPLVPDVAYALAIWTPEQAGQGINTLRESPLLFPLLMWATSLVVAFWAIHRLVIRRVTDLGDRMRRFGRDRSLSAAPPEADAPTELREIDVAFRQMADSILMDEARMENAFRERGVLLREVHHRVKNNLQLISSIISMQIRRLPEPRVRSILRRLQDRVLTLASIYRSLYTSPDMSDVNAAPVLRAILEHELRAAEGRVAATLDIEDLVLDPDKVVPLAFLASEAVSNAVSRASSADGPPSLSITFLRDGDTARLDIANSLAGPPSQEDPARGLGQHLMQAFAAQMGGPLHVEASDRIYRVSIAFPIEREPAETVPV
jgi:two-component sensor histidine kinase